ncbi:MAG TPA: DUF1508 domain-containing protein [Acidimicrobiales bacterium]|nr:DUF1508 domain-containing protein [Acidimicrobiales bacterium]
MPSRLTLTVYRDAAGEWRWALQAANGRKVADSGEGYQRRARCVEMGARLFPDARLVIED